MPHEQLIIVPVHGSEIEPQKFGGHVALVQHSPPTPQTGPPGALLQLLLEQSTVFPLQSFAVVQLFAPQASGHTHSFDELHVLPPEQPPQLKASPQAFFTVPHFAAPPST